MEARNPLKYTSCNVKVRLNKLEMLIFYGTTEMYFYLTHKLFETCMMAR